MKFSDYVARGVLLAGSAEKLAIRVGVSRTRIQDAKADRIGLPVASCYMLAEFISEDERSVVAASELVTEKKPERRAALLPFVGQKAAGLIMTIATTTIIGTSAIPAESYAAQGFVNMPSESMYIM